MGHKHDFWETLREVLARPIGALAGRRCTKEKPARFVGYVEMPVEEFEVELHDMDFERNPLSYWKKVEKLSHERGSWRKVDGKWQIHTILYQKDDWPERTYVYSHWEHRWDVAPLKHLRGKDINTTKGVNEMRRELMLASIDYYNDPTIQ